MELIENLVTQEAILIKEDVSNKAVRARGIWGGNPELWQDLKEGKGGSGGGRDHSFLCFLHPEP